MKLLHRHSPFFMFLILAATMLLVVLGSYWGTHRSTSSNTGDPIVMSQDEETVTSSTTGAAAGAVLYEYVKVTNSCDTGFEGECVNVRSSPSVNSPVVFKARNNLVLKVTDKIESGGRSWYKLSFAGEWLRYPERVDGDMYISAEYVTHFLDEGSKNLTKTSPQTNKHLLIDRSEQMLYAYDGEILFMTEKVSTGIKLTPTPRGEFTVYRKTPSRYMQGPIPGISDHYYDLPGVPWNLYFTEDGAVIHGAYWHDKFGQVWSNGCVNLPPDSAEKLYKWADIGTKVLVRD